jgi:hypothetical protein
MAESNITFEQIDALMGAVDLSGYQPGGKSHLTAASVQANPAAALPKICPIYKAVKPILKVLVGLPFIPPAWRTVITTFIGLMDALCP